MTSGLKIALVATLAAAVAGTVALRESKRAADAARAGTPAPVSSAPAAPAAAPTTPTIAATPAAAPSPVTAPAKRAVPRVIEFGSNRCMACQQMAVVLDQLRASQGERLQVDFLDVMENPELGEPYKISLIPTQVLLDASGTEIFRHTGFFSHDDIIAKFRELGVKL